MKYDATSDYPAGTTVQWTNKFLRSIGYGPKGEVWRERATVLKRPDVLGGFDPRRYLVVQWDHLNHPSVVALANVAKQRTTKLLDNPLLKAGHL